MKKLFIILLTSPIWCQGQIELEGNFIKATGSGGVPPFTYNMDGGSYQVKDTFFNVPAGPHTLNAKDAFGCIKPQSFTMFSPLVLTLTSTRSSITAVGSGGKSPYTYSRNNGLRWQTSGLFTGLTRRTTYTILVKDALGFITTKTITTL